MVQSVYRSFFHRIDDDRLDVGESGQLWGLLAAITVNKVKAKARFHGADKRNVKAESSVNASVSCYGLSPEEIARDPTSDEVTAVTEQYNNALAELSPLGQTVFQLHLENEPVSKIAERVKRSERTIRRELERVRELLRERLELGNP